MQDLFEAIDRILAQYPARHAGNNTHDTEAQEAKLSPEHTSEPPSTEDQISDLERLEIIVHKLRFIANEHRPQVALVEGKHDSLTVVRENDYLNQLILLAGGRVYSGASISDIQHTGGPDVVIIIDDSPIGNTLTTLPTRLENSPWINSKAAAQNNFFLVYKGSHLDETNPHPAEDAEILAEILHPGYFIFGRNEDVWMPFHLS